jgi:hypothetical protein
VLFGSISHSSTPFREEPSCNVSFISALTLCGLLLTTQACSLDGPTVAESPTDPGSIDQPEPSDQAVDWLARGLARALEDPELRQQILEDMRDGPFTRHNAELKWLGIQDSPVYVGEPQTNGIIERFMRR